ncbi:hypothetical protein LRC484719_53710 [Mycobacterium riyadhense]|uniref:hypothetical protein n=1 Tax=Mycobacterium riyadhense TaxID=486698 RepID=UPI0021F28C09|nr:hypothetical protein [Mycobacterium riyadhense]MCV7144328.1 hypothetical protein [Mycobacterium riyadhense]
MRALVESGGAAGALEALSTFRDDRESERVHAVPSFKHEIARESGPTAWWCA